MITARTIMRHIPSEVRKRLPKKVAVFDINEGKSRALNQTYRKKNRPANVLSFRYDDSYGEILVCPAVIRREAKKQGNATVYQMTWMIAHGMLHLAGIHHERSLSMKKQAHRLEERILTNIFKQKDLKLKTHSVKQRLKT